MTMANATSSSNHRPSASALLRKTNKPLMEKRRRARINDSLGQLKSLVVTGSKKDASAFNKLEKADILELTVKHLRAVQSAHSASSANVNPAETPAVAATKYRAGFIECANEVMRFLKTSSGFSDDLKTRVLTHLGSCLHTSQQQQQQQQIQQQQQHQQQQQQQAASYPVTHPVASQLNSNPRVVNPAPAQPSQQIPQQQQVIQIINPANFNTSAAAVTPVLSVPQNAVFVSTSSSSSSSSSTSSNVPAAAAADLSRLCQPLSIQIPVNRVASQLMQKAQKQQQQLRQKQQQQQQQQMQPKQLPRLEPKVELPVQSSLPLSSSSSSSSSSVSPIHNKPSLPMVRSSAYKQLDFYSNDTQTHHHIDTFPRSRSLSSSTSSSSHSSDCEMASPLNLSQTPPSSEAPSSASSTSSSSILTDKPYTHKKYGKSSSSSSTEFTPATFTSDPHAISRKSLDIPSSKYMRMMMEDERPSCPRDAATPSPASSMGETTVWRPW